MPHLIGFMQVHRHESRPLVAGEVEPRKDLRVSHSLGQNYCVTHPYWERGIDASLEEIPRGSYIHGDEFLCKRFLESLLMESLYQIYFKMFEMK